MEILEQDRKVLGSYIKILAQQNNLTQKKLSQELGINRSTISKIWTGTIKKTPSYEKLCAHFGQSLSEALQLAHQYNTTTPTVVSTRQARTPSSPVEVPTRQEEVEEDEEELFIETPPVRTGYFDAVDGLVLTVAAEKGGVGKTTTAVSLSGIWAERGHRVLLIDLDIQGNASEHLGFGTDGGRAIKRSLTDIDTDGTVLEPLVTESTGYGFDLIQGGRGLAYLEQTLVAMQMDGRHDPKTFLDKALAPLREDYDLIIIDTPPSLSIITISAFQASDYVIIPTQTQTASVTGARNVYRTIAQLQNSKPSLRVLCSVATLHDKRNLVARLSLEELEEETLLRLANTIIGAKTQLAQAYTAAMPINLYAPGGPSHKQYAALADECEARLTL